MKTKINKNGNNRALGIAMAIIILFVGLLPAYSEHHKIETSYYDIAHEYNGNEVQSAEYQNIGGGG